MDPLALLGRKDKWFLGGGSGAIAAAPFPRHLTATGFWDECYFADIRIPRLFTIFVLQPDGTPIKFESYHKGWRPDRLTIMHYSGNVVIRERRCITADNAWVSELELVTAVGELTVVLYSMFDVVPCGPGTPWQSASNGHVSPESISLQFETAWPDEIEADRTGIDQENLTASGAMMPTVPLHLVFGSSHRQIAYCGQITQRQDDAPVWEASILPQKMVNGRFPDTFQIEGDEGTIHLAQQYTIDDRRPIILACGSGLTHQAAQVALKDACRDHVIDRSGEDWRAYFNSVPQFESSDPYLNAAYWYRWYGLRLNTVNVPGLKNLNAPFVTEGVGFFRNFITYSSQAILREVSWMHSPKLGLGILENLKANQRPDGSFPGHTYSGRPARDFYHADFATGPQQLESLHNVKIDREPFEKYFAYLQSRQTEDGMVQIFDQNETGQEYMSRYTEANPRADQWESFRMGGVDSTAYFIALARWLGKTREAADAQTALELLSYDPKSSFYCDLIETESPESGWWRTYVSDFIGAFNESPHPSLRDNFPAHLRRSPARPATGFYSLLVQTTPRKSVLTDWLLNESEFWLPAGFPATNQADPTFSAVGEWKGKRLNCPWNGRSWPMVNSHIVDGLANQGPEFAEAAAAALTKSVRLMFHRADSYKPSSYEHYDPITGTPALYRGFDDYMHSWIVDLILRHVVGIRPGKDEVRPLPLDLDFVHCEKIPHPRGFMRVTLERGQTPVIEIEPRPSSG